MSATPAPAASAAIPNPDHVLRLAAELNVKVFQVAATAQLLAEGATVPFIARYRKEATGELDEVQVLAVRDRLEQWRAVDERRAAILASLRERGLATPALEQALAAADTLAALEDIYLPFRPKRRTRATIAGVLAEVSEWPQPAFDERLYAASSAQLFGIVRQTPADVGTLMLVAHNPGMQMLATEIGGAEAWSRVGKYPTGSLAVLELDGDWAEARSGRLTDFVAPRDLV